jgi:hypothetical protein
MMNQNRADNSDNQAPEFSLSRALRGRQSVRATFKLTSECIDAISIVAAQLGIKQKSLFDHLMEDLDALSDLARQLNADQLGGHGDRVQKTYVLSRRSLLSLESMAHSLKAPRDALVELLAQRLLPIIAKERQRHLKRKALIDPVVDHYRKAQQLAKQLESQLGPDDPMVAQFKDALSCLASAMENISTIIERGQSLEAFEIDEFSDPKS